MTSETSHGTRVLGELASDGGSGVVRIEDRHEVGVEDLWSALTEPQRLAGWYGKVDGDLRPGGAFRADLGHWVGTGRVDACERAERLLVTLREVDATDETVVEATLTPDADQTVLVIQVRGLPLDLLGAYGVGWQIHAENLAAHLAGRGRVDSEARWAALTPAYKELAAAIA
jgi:uncharacterized protein YndB with AHSA1/START domain